MIQVPTVDMRDPSRSSLQALDAACRDHGFFLLEGHGLDALIEQTWDQTRRFFASPRDIKQQLVRSETHPLGYYDRELTKQKRDHKEVFDFAQPRDAADSDPNRWPASMPEFRATMAEFFGAFSQLAVDTLGLVHAALGLSEEEAKQRSGSQRTSTVRLNHYPVGDPVAEVERAGLNELGDVALGHHTDPGVITLLLQDDTGGLQTASREDGWIDVPPRAGTVVVNLADVVQVWTNDQYRAAIHRVVPMTRASRFSIPYFFNPAADALVEPIPALCQDNAPVYRGFEWREFMKARIDDNYADLGADDTQIAHYRLDRAAS